MKSFIPRTLALALTAVAVACAGSDGPPRVVLDRTACSHCGMLVSDLRFAGAYRSGPGYEPRVFDDLGCMVDAWHQEPEMDAAVAWVVAEDGAWVDAATAWYVRGPYTTPMGGGVLAFATRAAAEAEAARQEEATVLSLSELLGGAGEEVR